QAVFAAAENAGCSFLALQSGEFALGGWFPGRENHQPGQPAIETKSVLPWRFCMPSRREFLKTTIIAGTAIALFRGSEGKTWAYAQSPNLRKFVAPLPGLGPKGIPVATPTTNSAWPGADFYQ